MQLKSLIPYPLPAHSPNPTITGLALDSRLVKPGYLFFALAGSHTHGTQYLTDALQRGAVAIFQQAEKSEFTYFENLPCLKIPNLNQRIGEIAAQFYDNPSRDLSITGITGTNGKTSVSHFLAQLLNHKATCAILGTLGYGVYGNLQPGDLTTPDAIRLQAYLAQFRQQQVRYVTMEVSSHALVQGRVNAVQFHSAVFTNLSHDHLDYHGSLEAYGAAKALLFQKDTLQAAIINRDDGFSIPLLAKLPPTSQPLTYSVQTAAADVFAQIMTVTPQGYLCQIHTAAGSQKVSIPLAGYFNISNVLAALATALTLGLSFKEICAALPHLQPVIGRLERFTRPNSPMVMVDYAHTPDALRQALTALRPHCLGNLWCVFGCGGDRDQAKRPFMGKVAQQLADRVIITDDNPRHEDPQAIINDILHGCQTDENGRIKVITPRDMAIHHALNHADSQDIVLLAGKGHETYQQIGDQRLPFSDREVCMQAGFQKIIKAE